MNFLGRGAIEKGQPQQLSWELDATKWLEAHEHDPEWLNDDGFSDEPEDPNETNDESIREIMDRHVESVESWD